MARPALIRFAGFEKVGRFHKVAGDTAFGWACVSTVKGLPYFDTGDGTHSDHIPEDSLVDVATAFMDSSRIGLDMHDGDPVADVVFAYPNTSEILKGLGLEGDNTGLAIGWRTSNAELLDKIAKGDRIGFSIGGSVTAWDIVDLDGNVIESHTIAKAKCAGCAGYMASDAAKCPGCGKAAPAPAKRATFGKAACAGYDGSGKMKRRIFRLWKLGEISLVDYPMQEPALVGVVKSARVAFRKIRTLARIRKQAALTDVVDGHQHTIDLNDPAIYSNLSTSYETMEGAEYGHSHSWVYDDATGAVTIALAAGHTHTVSAAVTADVLAAAAAREAAIRAEITEVATGAEAPDLDDDTDDGTDEDPDEDEGNANDASSPGTAVAIMVNLRAWDALPGTTDAGSLRSVAAPDSVTSMADAPNPEVATLQKRNAFLERFATMTDAQRAHYSKLAGDDASAFVMKSAIERDKDVKAALDLDPPFYTSKASGRVYRESQRESGELAKRLDEQDELILKANAERDDALFAKTASDTLGHLAFKCEAGKYDDAVALVKAVHFGITDKDQRARVMLALKAADAIADAGYTAQGDEGNPDADPAVQKIGGNVDDARAELQKMAEEAASKDGVRVEVAKRKLLQVNKRARSLFDVISANRGGN